MRTNYRRAAAHQLLSRHEIRDHFTDGFEAKNAARNRLVAAKNEALDAITAYAKSHGCSSDRDSTDPEVGLMWRRFDRLGA